MHVHFKIIKISRCYILYDLEKAVFVGCYGGHGAVGYLCRRRYVLVSSTADEPSKQESMPTSKYVVLLWKSSPERVVNTARKQKEEKKKQHQSSRRERWLEKKKEGEAGTE